MSSSGLRAPTATFALAGIVSLAAAHTCRGQDHRWELGAAGGFGLVQNATISNPTGNLTAGIDNRFALSGVAGQDLYQHLSGELRYVLRDDDLVLKGGGQKANMDGESHLIHYDLLVHARGRRSRIRPYAAGGAGIRLFRGTGKEDPNQRFRDFAFITRANEVKPLISVGGGVKVSVTRRISVHVDFRDYISPFPEELFVPAPAAKIRGWVHDFVPMAGISFGF
jgi:hypothetical protein